LFAPGAQALLAFGHSLDTGGAPGGYGDSTGFGQFPNLCGKLNMVFVKPPMVYCYSSASLGSFDVPAGVTDVTLRASSSGGTVQATRQVTAGDGFTFTTGQPAVGQRGGYPDGGDAGSVDARGGDGSTEISAAHGSLLMIAPGRGGAGAPASTGSGVNCATLDSRGHAVPLRHCVEHSRTCGSAITSAPDPADPNAGDSIFYGAGDQEAHCGLIDHGGDNAVLSAAGHNPTENGQSSFQSDTAHCDGTQGSAGQPAPWPGHGGGGGRCYDTWYSAPNNAGGGGGGGGGLVGGGGGAGGGESHVYCEGPKEDGALDGILSEDDWPAVICGVAVGQGGAGGSGGPLVPAGGAADQPGPGDWETNFSGDVLDQGSAQQPQTPFFVGFGMAMSIARPNQPLPPATVGQPYGPIQLTATTSPAGLPVYWDADGLPDGITLSPHGVLSGTPTAAFQHSVRIEASIGVPVHYNGDRYIPAYKALFLSSTTANVSTQTFTATCKAGGFVQGDPFLNQAYWTVANPDPTKFTVPPSGWVGVPYHYQYQATGSSAGDHYEYWVTQGELPAGLHLDDNTGVVSGVPQAPTTWFNTSPMIVTAVDDNGCGVSTSRPWGISVLPQPVAGEPYSGNFLLLSDFDTSFDGSVSFGFGPGLPPGIGPSSSDPGANHGLTGTPTTVGNSTYRVTESYGVAQDGTRPDPNVWYDTMPVLAEPVAPPPPPVHFTGSLPAIAARGTQLTQHAAADAGLNAPGSQPSSHAAADGPSFVYHYQATGDTGLHYALVSGDLPPGLTLADDGTLSGTPTTAGSYGYTVAAIGDHTTADSHDRIDVTPSANSGFTIALSRGDSGGGVQAELVPVVAGVAKLTVTVPTASIASLHGCRRNTVKLHGRCRPRETVIATATGAGQPGVPLALRAKPRASVLRKLKHGRTLHAVATLIYTHGGVRSQPVVTKVVLHVKKAPRRRK
jgi:hypothetical protein